MFKYLLIVFLFLFNLSAYGEEGQRSIKQQLDRLQRDVNDLSKLVYQKNAHDIEIESENKIESENSMNISAFDMRIYDLEKDIKKLNSNFEEAVFQIDELKILYEELKKQGNVAFLSTSFLRGITLDNAIVLVDECQNLNFHELDTIMTRVGQDSKIMFSGDFDQTDLREDEEKAGLGQFIKIINEMKEFYSCEFDIGDIVRSGLVRSYIIQKYNTGLGDRK